MADRHNRIKAVISRNIADIVQFEIKNPRVGMVSVNEVEVYDDYSQANVFVSFLDPRYKKQKLAELQKVEGFVRSSLAKKMDTYKVPRIRFFLDETAEQAKRLDEALAKESEQLSSFPEGEEGE